MKSLKILLFGRISIDIFKDHNYSKIGGTIFNITKGLVEQKTKAEITLIAPVAKDGYANEVNTALNLLGINLIKINIEKTPLEIYRGFDKELDLFNLESKLTNSALVKDQDSLSGYDVIVADLHSIEIINLLVALNPQARIFLDATSQTLVSRLNTLKLNNVYIKFNRKQASAFSNHLMYDLKDYIEVMEILRNKGFNNVVITLDKDGCFYFNNQEQGILKAAVITEKKYYDAGDAFHAGLIYGYSLSNDLSFMAKVGIDQSAKQIKKEIDARFLKASKLDKQ